MNIFLFFSIFLFCIKYNLINCGNTTCFEYSCEECDSEQYGSCTKCRRGFHLIDGTCPCCDNTCALCTTGLAGLNICKLCKNGYYRMDDDCHCEVDHCEICEENGCKKCYAGYYFNSTNKTCLKYEENDPKKINCYDINCDICLSEEQGACDTCKDGYYYVKGECLKAPEPDNTKCENGFYFSDNYCKISCLGVECNQNQIFYKTCPGNPCLVCSENELKVFSKCNNSDICKREGCLNCIDNDYCLICDQSYYLVSGICRKCTYGCSICSNNDTCDYCISGFKLNEEEKCVLENNNDFDFPLKKYNKYKYQLLKENYPNEITNITEDIEDIIECDSNCNKCYDNSGICTGCKELYQLENNKCIKHCSNENCLDCFMRYGNEICTKCEEGYYVKGDKCAYNCSDTNCLSCYLLDGKELCTQCKPDYNLENLKCKSRSKLMAIISIIITALLFITLIICFCYYRKKLVERRHELIRELQVHGNDPNVVPYNMQNGDSSNRIINKEDIMDEFEKRKTKMEKGNQQCQYCKKQPGKYQSDCGCILCKEHSKIKTVKEKGQDIKVCINCGKVVKKIPIPSIKYDCNICLQKRNNVVHFKCECAFVVCKDCYIKCRMESDKCPGCRTILD